MKNEASLNITESADSEEEGVTSSNEPQLESTPSKCPAGYILNQTTLLCDGTDLFYTFLIWKLTKVNKIWTSASSTAKFAAKTSLARTQLALTSAQVYQTSPATQVSVTATRQTFAKVCL